MPYARTPAYVKAPSHACAIRNRHSTIRGPIMDAPQCKTRDLIKFYAVMYLQPGSLPHA